MRFVRVAERQGRGGPRLGATRRPLFLARFLVPGTILAAALVACAPVPSVPAAPRGIVSVNPCSDAILAEVADPAQIRALSRYSRDPASSSMDVGVARRFPAVSGTVEEIVALRPAVVVASTFTPPATRAALARLGIALVELPIATSVEESLGQVRQLAALAGQPARGAELEGRISAALAAAAPPPGPPIPALVWQSGGIVPGEQTLIADLLRRSGFTNAAAARGLGQADFLPLERVLANPPRLILAAGDHSGEDRLLAHPALARLPGTVRARLDPSLLWCGGPTIIRAAARLAEVRRALGVEVARGLRQAQAERGGGVVARGLRQAQVERMGVTGSPNFVAPSPTPLGLSLSKATRNASLAP